MALMTVILPPATIFPEDTPNMSLAGKGFLVTGGTGSIGGACCQAIIEKGGMAIALDIIPDEAGQEKVRTFHAERAFYKKADITDEEAMKAACDYALSVLPKGGLWGVVHCAAIAPGKPWSHKLTDSIAKFKTCLHVNTYGTFVVDAVVADAINSQYPDEGPFAPRVREERGVIINIASIVAKPVPARCLSYGTSKSAVLGLSGALADFLGPFGIRVNTVSPAIVQSALMGPDRIPYFVKELENSAIFPHRLTLPEEIGSAVTFLIEHPLLNDMDLRVDGGWRNCSNWAAGDPRKNAISLE